MKLCIQMQERDQVATVLQKTSPGDELRYGDLTITVLETDDKRVEKVRVTRGPEAPNE